MIFPPYLGMEAGTAVWPAVLGFIVTGVGAAAVVSRGGGVRKDGIRSLGNAVHPLFSLCFSLAVYLAIGPFFGIPRAASVAYEIGAKPFFPESGSLVMWLFTGLFFRPCVLAQLKPVEACGSNRSAVDAGVAFDCRALPCRFNPA
ncbi:branched-chain amino acid transport system II carrier protein [Geobacillus subterraneus]|uniref:branched-chain amino acid transport system II carrier protein n=1 Tax=Geobacillus subterraneus TaxID=129338 RepID=UPI002FF6682C